MVTLSHKSHLMVWSQALITKLKRRKKKILKQSDIIQHRYYESELLGLDSEVTLYRVYTRELDGELCTE